MNIDTLKTIARLLWPWLLSILCGTVLPKIGWDATTIAAVQSALNAIFVIYFGSTVAVALNKAGIMQGFKFTKK